MSVINFDSNGGINKKSEGAMKNKMIVILTLLLMGAGIVGSAFANPVDESRYPTASSSNPVYFGHTYR